MGRHVILTSGRSGSNLLVATLNQHPQVMNYGEVLGRWMLPARLHDRFGYGGSTPETYLDHTLGSRRHFWLAQGFAAGARTRNRRRPGLKRWGALATIGIKEFSTHLHRRGLQRYLAERPDIEVVHLVRANQLRRVLSLESMRATGRAKAESADHPEAPRLSPDPDRVVAMLDRLEDERAAEERLVGALEPDRVLHVDFDDLTASASATQAGADRIFGFLGVDPVPVSVRHRRLSPPRLADQVDDPDALAEVLVRRGYGHYLDAPGAPR